MKQIKNFFNREQNLLMHIIATILVTIFGVVFKIKLHEWLLVYTMITFVITSELINSAIELAVDLYTTKFHPKAKIAKDVSAGAVLISAIAAICVGVYVFFPKILSIIK